MTLDELILGLEELKKIDPDCGNRSVYFKDNDYDDCYNPIDYPRLFTMKSSKYKKFEEEAVHI
jgi:hypothetical protein